jgi:zinc transport system permease protein
MHPILGSLLEIFESNPFLQMALLAGFAASITSGIVGSYVVAKRIVFISGSIAHSVLGGMGFFLWLKRSYGILWLTPLQGALIAALISALLIGWIHLKFREREDTVIAALWSTGMSIGVIFVALTPGYNVELMNFLFGNILWVSHADLAMLIGLDLVVLITASIFHHRFIAICFDEEQATLQGLNVSSLYLLLLCLVAISVVLLIQIVGAILVIAMLAIPAAIASVLAHRMIRIMAIAILLGCGFTLVGTSFSYFLNWPPGATISLCAALFYCASLLRKTVIR